MTTDNTLFQSSSLPRATPAESVATAATNAPRSYADNGLQDYIAVSRYSRYDVTLRRRETWSEAVARVAAMHCEHYLDRVLAPALAAAEAAGDIAPGLWARLGLPDTLHGGIAQAFAAVTRRAVLPSMRSLQFGGLPVLTKHPRIYNCAFTYIDRPAAFKEVFFLLLCGCGVGFSVQHHHIAHLPPLAPLRSAPPLRYIIADTIEGWADALDQLIRAAFTGYRVIFDYSSIRPAGAPLRTTGGKAPGPAPLFQSLTHIAQLLTAAAGRALHSLEIYDILMWAAKAVLSGGIRRSATLCLFSADDEAMARAKTGDWFSYHPQRAASNNSAVIVRREATRAQFTRLFELQKQCGEPGFYFVEDRDHGANPCVEIGLHPRLHVDAPTLDRLRQLDPATPAKIGQTLSGVQFCNLSTISAAAATDEITFQRQCAWAALIGTLQAGYTHFRYLSPVSRVVTEREALLGVSICGFLDRPELLLDREVLRRGAATVQAINAVVARALDIPPAARTTCVKPEGTASLLLGTSSGLHPHHAPRYFRRVQANRHDPVYRHFYAANAHLTASSVYDPAGHTDVITFPVEAPPFGLVRADLSALAHLTYVRRVQENWVQAGRRHEHHSPGLHHSVSCTITVRPEEWADVEEYLWQHRSAFGGVAMLPETGDKIYAQAPREALATPEDYRHWDTLAYRPVDYTALEESEDLTELRAEAACAGGACELVRKNPVSVSIIEIQSACLSAPQGALQERFPVKDRN
jgi:ribonucleoside-triphosphate reductase (thioredoxin)